MLVPSASPVENDVETLLREGREIIVASKRHVDVFKVVQRSSRSGPNAHGSQRISTLVWRK
jgi:hypothetical protein